MPVYIPPISRREFLAKTSVAATGIILGFNGLFRGSGNVDPDYFVLFADTHISQYANQMRGDVHLIGNLKAAMERILENQERRPAALIINGDAARLSGLKEDYEMFVEAIKPISESGIPIYITMGNHDDREPFFEVMPEMKPDEVPISQRHIEILDTPNVYLILLDTLDQVNEAPGIFGQEQLVWLDETLPQYNDKPVMLFGHHNPGGLQDRSQFYAILDKHRHVKAYFFGHTHRWAVSRRDGLHLVNQPATSYVFDDSQPSGLVHADFKDDHVYIRLDCLDKEHVWHGQQGSLPYRSGVSSVLENAGSAFG